MENILLIINPISGGINKFFFINNAVNSSLSAGKTITIYSTDGVNDEQEIREIVDKISPSRIAVAGGDGTIALVARCILKKNIPLGIIPMGSANGIAVELDLPGDPINAFNQFLKSEKTIFLDAILVNDKYYCFHIGDVGINAQLVEGFSQDENRGLFTYAKYFIKELLRKEIFDYEIVINNRKIHQSGYMMAFANASRYGTGVIINPEGKTNDGYFELVNVKNIDSEAILAVGLSALIEDVPYEQYSDILRCKEATIKLNVPKTLQIDGEIIGLVSEINCKIIEAAIKIIDTTI